MIGVNLIGGFLIQWAWLPKDVRCVPVRLQNPGLVHATDYRYKARLAALKKIDLPRFNTVHATDNGNLARCFHRGK
jgi:hypothetical protein